MALSPLANDPSERYSELERAYTEDRWPDVLEQGGQLIADLSNDPDPVAADLASRAHLLLGHAHLYGRRDPAAALPHYQALLAGSADPELRRIAEEALPYCQTTVEPAAPEAAAGVSAMAPTTATDATAAAAASPTVAQELFPRAAIKATAEPLGDRILATQGQWIHQAGTASEPITEAATPWLDGPIRQEQAIQTGVDGMIAAPDTTIGELVPSLEVEVVEEPELMEVAQADPSLAEELEIELTRIRERRAFHQGDETATQELTPPGPADSLAEPDDLMEDPELLAGLLRVMVTP
jgi:hypothetical protein